MPSELLFTPKLTGDRFEQHTLPADVLGDIAALQELLVSLAKAAYVAADPNRIRAPRNFDKDVQLHLGPRGEGSTALPLMLVYGASLVAPYRPAFDTAREQFTEAVDSAAHGRAPTLAPKYLAYFDKIGRSLRSNEALQVPMQTGETRLTQETRQRLLEASRVEEYTERATLRVRVPATDNTAAGSFKVELLDGTVVPGKLDLTIEELFADAHYRYKRGGNPWLLLECVVRKERSGRLKSIDSIQEVSSLDPLDVAVRLNGLSKLEHGWLDGSGRAPDQDGLLWLTDAMASFYSTALPLPHLYPTPEGGIQAEWTFGREDTSLNINLETKTGEYDRYNLDTETFDEEVLQLSSQEGWEHLNELLAAVQGSAGSQTEASGEEAA